MEYIVKTALCPSRAATPTVMRSACQSPPPAALLPAQRLFEVIMPNQESILQVQDVHFRYDPEQPKYAVDGVTLDIRRGEFVAVLGANGCGKSTLAKHFKRDSAARGRNCPRGGDGHPQRRSPLRCTSEGRHGVPEPDNQIVATIVEGRGLCAGKPRRTAGEIAPIDDAMKLAVSTKRDAAPYKLSGGQKQRVAIAGVIAMRPDCLVLDESTAMLDPTAAPRS